MSIRLRLSKRNAGYFFNTLDIGKSCLNFQIIVLKTWANEQF